MVACFLFCCNSYILLTNIKKRRKIKMKKIPWFVCILIVFWISFVINTILAIVKGNKKFKVRAIIDAFLGMLSVFPALFYYGILSMRGPSCTSYTPAGHLILIIIIKIYCVIKEKELVKEWWGKKHMENCLEIQ